jgi:hypothetical protein
MSSAVAEKISKDLLTAATFDVVHGKLVLKGNSHANDVSTQTGSLNSKVQIYTKPLNVRMTIITFSEFVLQRWLSHDGHRRVQKFKVIVV